MVKKITCQYKGGLTSKKEQDYIITATKITVITGMFTFCRYVFLRLAAILKIPF
jgi:hypothetical protein